MIDRPPEVVSFTVNLREHFVEVPPPAAKAHALDAALADFGRKLGPKPVAPEPHGFVADIDATLVQQVLDSSKQERDSNMEHDG